MKESSYRFLKQTLYTFQCPNELFTPLIDFNNALDWSLIENRAKAVNDHRLARPGKSYSSEFGSLTEEFSLRSVHEWITHCFNTVLQEIGWRESSIRELFISQSWLNCSSIGELHHRHTHNLSLLSSILYLTENCKTDFYLPSIYNLGAPLITAKQRIDIKDTYTAKAGDLIIFPSTLEHSVEPNLEPFPRITLSCNSWFKGNTGNIAELAYIGNYQTKSHTL